MGGKTSKSTQAITIPPEVLARYNAVNSRADTVTNKPYQYYGGQFVAPLTATQRSGIENTNAAANMAQPYYGAAGDAYGAGLAQGQEYLGEATQYARAGGQGVDPTEINGAAINKYMSPYLQNVLQGTAGLLNQQNQLQQSGQMGNAIRSGAFGGDRGGIAAANLNQQQNLANAKIFSDILNEGYNNALNTAVGQQAVGLGAAQANRAAIQQTADRVAGLGQQGYEQFTGTGQKVQDLGTTAQGAALAGAGAQLTAGGVEQATQQAENIAKYNEFLQAQSLPYQQLKLASDIALGTGTASGSTTTTAQPGGFFSDERLKENIKAIGKTFDGQTIHSYNYRGDPRTQIGLIAQEVQKHHPDAVGLAGGYKTVDYDKATEDAADRGHMAHGGYASMGGGVMPEHAGQGFAGGGVAGFDPAVMQQILSAQQAMYEPLSKSGMYAGGPNAGGGLVPQSEVVARQLMTPAELPKQATGAEQAKSMVDLGNSINQFGEGVGAWGGKPKGKDTPPPPPEKTKGSFQESLYQDPDYDDDYKGGLFHRALGGGTPYNGQGLDIPQEDATAKTYQPMTPASLEKQESGLDKLGKVAKIAGTVASIFSDKHMKENIRPIGKLFDGQIVHSFNYKGDPRTQIGLIAQEVEGHKPHAVGNVHGMKAVDYAKATSAAAKRGHFAMGGEPMDVGLAGAERDSQEPDFNLDPEDILSGGDEDAEFFMRNAMGKKETPAQAAGLGALESNKDKILDAYKTTPAFKPRPRSPTGLAPSMGALPKDIMQIARLIHAGEGTGKNPLSSARGPYQMIDSTFAGEFRKNYPDRAKGMSDSQIIALKHSPEGYAISEAMGPRLIASNAKIVERGGFEPDAGNVYLAHFLGPDTAVRVLRANPNEPIGRYVSREAIAANPPLQKNPTVGGTINWARGYMAKQANYLNRNRRSAGGLAGRDGYQVGGSPKTDQELAEELTANTPTEEVIPAPPMRKTETAPQAGLAAGEAATTTPTDTTPATGVAPPVEDIVVNAKPDPRGRPQRTPRENIYGRGKQDPLSYEGGKIPNYSYDYMTEPFFKGIKRGSAGSIIPLLTGIAAMGTAPTRSLGVALATGLGAGAQSYAGLANERNKQLVQRQIGTARYADSVRAYFEKEAVPLGGGKYYYRGREINQAEYDQMLNDAITNKSGVLLPSIPETAKPYQAPKAPEPAKPVEITDKPDMSTTTGVFAAAFNDSIAQNARQRIADAREVSKEERLKLGDAQLLTSPTALQAVRDRITAAESAETSATAELNKRLGDLTGTQLATLGAAQQETFLRTVERAAKLQEEFSAMRPLLQQIDAMKKVGFKGGPGQGGWATIADFISRFGNLSEEQSKLLGSAADDVSRQKILASTFGGAVFDPANPGKAAEWLVNNVILPRATDIRREMAEINKRATPTAMPTPTTGIATPVTRAPEPAPPQATGKPASLGRDNVWRAMRLEDIMNDSRIKKGAPYEILGPDGRVTGEGKK